MMKKSVAIIFFYLFSAAMILWLDKISPSGPCNAGLGIIAFLTFIPIGIIPFLASLYTTIRKDKSNLKFTILHMMSAIAVLIALN